ncbi:MAG: hypothetical protein LC768_14705 [Acidobacteria bacterium]|nr:hypothetical protein [Acidobacteriota bacterium]MCA1639557.1 hypothetical protein [Acidobacteriota bacterium]
MLKRLIYCLVGLMLLVTISVGFGWETKSAGKVDEKVRGSGTSGQIAKWIDSDRIGDSVITEDANGQIAIGTTPSIVSKFLVVGTFDNPNSAIRGINNGTGRGVQGQSQNGIGVNGGGKIGVNGITTSTDPNDSAVRGISQFGTALAGDFSGNVRVTGMLTKGGGSFRIDHPLDPKNKYLSHSFVESPDMMNIYNGTATTDGRGEAVIALPSYFDALNRDFRYQLTVIGQFAQAIVAEKIKGNQFKIKTDKPRVEVSWQVTGIRQDKFAEQNRIQVEVEKPKSERGTLQNP